MVRTGPTNPLAFLSTIAMLAIAIDRPTRRYILPTTASLSSKCCNGLLRLVHVSFCSRVSTAVTHRCGCESQTLLGSTTQESQATEEDGEVQLFWRVSFVVGVVNDGREGTAGGECCSVCGGVDPGPEAAA